MICESQGSLAPAPLEHYTLKRGYGHQHSASCSCPRGVVVVVVVVVAAAAAEVVAVVAVVSAAAVIIAVGRSTMMTTSCTDGITLVRRNGPGFVVLDLTRV